MMSLRFSGNSLTALLATVILLVSQAPKLYASQEPTTTSDSDTPQLQIVIVEGNEAVNIVKKNTAVRPVVEVRDKNKAPGIGVTAMAGVAVIFLIHSEGGAGASFANGAKSATVMTDAAGRATAPEMHLAGTGHFNIDIQASYHGQTASRSITQFNYKTVASAHKAGKVPGHSTGDEAGAENASGGGASGGTGGAAGSSAAVGGSHAALIGGVVAAGAAAAGAGAYVASNNSSSNSGSNSSSQSNCTSLQNQFESDLQNLEAACNSNSQTCASSPFNQSTANDLSQLCSCLGAANSQQYVQQDQSAANRYGLQFGAPASCQ